MAAAALNPYDLYDIRSMLSEEEQETVEGCLRQIDFLDGEIALIDRKVAKFVLGSPDAQRLMTIPGIDVIPPRPYPPGLRRSARRPRAERNAVRRRLPAGRVGRGELPRHHG